MRDAYAIDDVAGLLLLTTVWECHDAMRAAQAVIDKHGPVVFNGNGTPRTKPACAVLRDSRAGMLSALKALRLDLEPLHDGPGRPPGD